MWPAAALDCALKPHEETARHVDDEDALRKEASAHVHDGDIAAEAAQCHAAPPINTAAALTPVPGVLTTEEAVCVVMMCLRWLWDENVSPLKRYLFTAQFRALSLKSEQNTPSTRKS